MKTLREINAWKKKHKVASSNMQNAWSRMWYSVSEDQNYNDWDELEETAIGFSQDEMTACCAIPVICYLDSANAGILKSSEAWEMFLSEYIRKKKYKYLLCTTTSKPEYKEINEALPKIGFKLQKMVKSKHTGKYPVYFWAYEESSK